MKTKIILFGALVTSSLMFGQVPFPHISNATTTTSAERGASFRVSDVTTDFLEITNSTQFVNQYIPAIWAHHQSDNRESLLMFGTTNSSQDNGTTPIVIFRSELRNSLAPNAPTGTVFPWGASGSPVANRPLFSWQNGPAIRMLMSANGNLGINTTTPTALLHTNGSLRFQSIPTVTTNTYVLTADANGVVSRQLSSSFGGSGLANSCNTTNFLTKRGATDLTCSQVFDNGTNVGINTTAPTAKFHNNGTLRLENIPTATANTYFLSADVSGNVSRQLVSSIAGVTSTCNTTNFIPKRGTTGLTCSQIFDNGTNVGIGTTTPSNKLTVNGAVQSISNLFISDIVYKQKIAPIENALELINGLNGKTYNWKVTEFPELNFDNTLQYGLIAQEVETVIPSIVQADENGRKAVNYSAIIPVLVEAVKQQQAQIIALQDQLNTSFQKQNSDLINLKNTKIISVSPNPSSDVIVISLNIEETVQDAKIVVYDLNGKIMSSLNVKERSNDISKSLQKDNFGSGTYIVSLFINGKSLDSKKIIFN